MRSALLSLLLVAGAFVVASAVAGALGAVNLGTALTFGQIAVALTVVYLIVGRRGERPPPQDPPSPPSRRGR